jgi:hypothetical protein
MTKAQRKTTHKARGEAQEFARRACAYEYQITLPGYSVRNPGLSEINVSIEKII